MEITIDEIALLSNEVVILLRDLVTDRAVEITTGSDILSELGLDSLQMIEFTDRLQAKYKVNFMGDPYSIADLQSPAKIALIIASHRQTPGRF